MVTWNYEQIEVFCQQENHFELTKQRQDNWIYRECDQLRDEAVQRKQSKILRKQEDFSGKFYVQSNGGSQLQQLRFGSMENIFMLLLLHHILYP